ncbi:MAG TPA: hypothetical protein PLK90_10625 [Clostridiales bacterium]|jgi:hypothetical protein|nr:hypothetical protein [Clostridiales bacterium]HQP70843.1 hypothetical protein [Clostridiales bacterium]
MKTDTMIKQEGFQALKSKLDTVEVERFIVLINREKFDYTKWRKDLFENMTIDEIAEKAGKYSKNN